MRQIVLVAFKAAVSIGLLSLALTRIDLGAAVNRINRLNITWILLSFATISVQFIFASIRWTVIAKHCGANLSLKQSLRLNLVGSFFNQVLPSTVGGDAAKIWIFAREGSGWAKATHSVLIDRFMGLLALAVFVTICLPWSFQLIRDPIGRLVIVLIGCGSAAGGAAFIMLGSQKWSWTKGFWATRQIAQLAIVARQSFTTVRSFTMTMGLSFLIQLLGASLGWSTAKAIGVPFDLAHALLLMPPIALITTIPISIAGWGVRESALMLGFSYAGLAPGDGVLVSILIGVVYFVLGAIGGGAWLLNGMSLSLPPFLSKSTITRFDDNQGVRGSK